MEFSEYQKYTADTAIYPHHGTCNPTAINYCVLGAGGEAGELSNTWKKAVRDGDFTTARERLRYELGDVLWYVSQLATELGMTLDQVAQTNLDKLKDRKNRNRLGGSGDDR
jgi:NTP pyrophosphatase (non-canonical NTP hydrolase)